MKQIYKLDKKFNNKARTYFKKGDYNKALSLINKAIELNPNKASYWNNKGLSLKNLNKYEEAVKCFNKAIEINPVKANYWNRKGLSLKNLNKHEEAVKCFNKAIEINPNKASYWNNKGLSLNDPGIWYVKKYEEAIECFNKAIELRHSNVEYLYNKSSALDNLGKHEEAKEWFNKAKEIENIEDIIVDFDVLPPGNIDRESNEWLSKNFKNNKEYNRQNEIIKFLKEFKPKKAKNIWSKEENYIIMLFDKEYERMIIAESGKYGDATYCYRTESFDNKDWIKVFKLDKQKARKRKGVETIYHDYKNNLENWKEKIREKLEE